MQPGDGNHECWLFIETSGKEGGRMGGRDEEGRWGWRMTWLDKCFKQSCTVGITCGFSLIMCCNDFSDYQTTFILILIVNDYVSQFQIGLQPPVIVTDSTTSHHKNYSVGQLQVKRQSRLCSNRKVAGSNPWLRQLHIKVSSSTKLNPKLILLSSWHLAWWPLPSVYVCVCV